MTELTDDSFLDGRVKVHQQPGGFRSGLDAVMLAAAVPQEGAGERLELGAGAGVASLCLAARLPSSMVVGVEIDEKLVALANANAEANQKSGQARFVLGDVLSMPAELKHEFAHVFANPPFHGSEGAKPPDAARARARHDEGRLSDWLEEGLRRTASGGTFTVILRADRLSEVLAILPSTGILVLPLWPRADAPAKRVIIQSRKGSGAPLAILPGLVLHAPDGRFTPEAEAILRAGASLALGEPRL